MDIDRIYIGCNGYVAAIRIADGEEIWRRKLGGAFSAPGGQDICLLEHEGRVYAGSNGHLFCLDGSTGEIAWRNELPGLGHNDVTLAMAGKAVQVVTKRERQAT